MIVCGYHACNHPSLFIYTAPDITVALPELKLKFRRPWDSFQYCHVCYHQIVQQCFNFSSMNSGALLKILVNPVGLLPQPPREIISFHLADNLSSARSHSLCLQPNDEKDGKMNIALEIL